MNSVPILSICIPTYNRANILEKTLENITNQYCFDNRSEIIVSDNCSTDNTKEIVLKYSQKFQNIKYYCNQENIGFDKNMKRSLDLANGIFIKPFNDYILFKEDTLNHILNTIEGNIKNKPVIFFLNQLTKGKYKIIECNNLNEFVLKTSFWACWLSSMGIWKNEYDAISNKNKYIGMEFFHYHLLLEYINTKNKIIIDNNDLFHNQQVPNKGGYNFFKIFTTNYLYILNLFAQNKAITSRTYKKEKEKLFKNHLLNYYIFLKLKKKFSFDTSNALGYILKNYTIYEVIKYTIEKVVYSLSRSVLRNTNKYFQIKIFKWKKNP